MPNGRTFQIKLVNVGTVGKYAVIYSWLYRRTLFNDGSEQRDIRPATAYVVTEKGYLHQYNHVKQTGYGGTSDLPQWERAKSLRGDPMLDLYYSYDAACHKQVGGRVWEQVPSLAGSTAEKTGLEEYLLCGGCFPVAYMQEWKKHPYIENLQKSGFGGQVADDIDLQINNHLGYGHRSGQVRIGWADLLKARPCDQLGMTKEEIRHLSETWNINMLENWAHYRYCSGQISATAYDAHRRVIGEDALTKLTAAACEMGDEGWLDKAARYLAKQVNNVDLAATAAEHLCDLWDMLEQREATGDIITDRELWPRNLQEAHDREINRIRAAEYAKIDPKFVKVAAKYAALEWTDGDLCIRLPRSNKELVEEGKVLRHCVGSYGTRHISESVIVFFVRHYRRPERSYYTMDYSFGKYGEYRRNQLHGYGNEHHGEYKQFSHRIPLKVIAFVERWEREVLGPWIARQAAEATRKGRKKKSA